MKRFNTVTALANKMILSIRFALNSEEKVCSKDGRTSSGGFRSVEGYILDIRNLL